MWVWREESVRGGWRLDATGSWTYDEPARLERVRSPRGDRDVESERYARERAREHRARAEHRRPALAAVPPLAELEATPIFRSVAHEARAWRDERREDRYGPRRAERSPRYERDERWVRRRRAEPAIPEPHPGSGPFPAQGQRGLAPVEAVPPPAWSGDDRPPSAEDELRRRAERRRRPRAEPESGRHVLRR